MTDDQAEAIANAVVGHGNQIAKNLVHLKAFTSSQNEQQENFLKSIQAENKALQEQSVSAARWAAMAAGAAALASAAQVALALIQP
jgi:hypothetical protein